MKKSIVFAHRGASAVAPENTMAAFKKAVELGSGGIELDIHMTKDKKLVVLHDDVIDRTSDGSGKIADLTLADVRKFDFGSWFSEEFTGERIPVLEDVLELVSKWHGVLNIEIKSGAGCIESNLLSLLKKFDFKEKVIVSSFNHYTLVNLRKLDSEIQTGPLYMEMLYSPWQYAKLIGANAIHPHYRAINKEIIDGCNENGVKINVFTVDRKDDIKMFASHKVNGIITNLPDEAIKCIEEIF